MVPLIFGNFHVHPGPRALQHVRPLPTSALFLAVAAVLSQRGCCTQVHSGLELMGANLISHSSEGRASDSIFGPKSLSKALHSPPYGMDQSGVLLRQFPNSQHQCGNCRGYREWPSFTTPSSTRATPQRSLGIGCQPKELAWQHKENVPDSSSSVWNLPAAF